MTEPPPKRSRRLQPAKLDVDPASWTTWLVPLVAFAIIAFIATGNLGTAQRELGRLVGTLLVLLVIAILAYRKWGSRP